MYAEYSGQIKGPVLTIHTKVDELVPTPGESAYKDLLERVGTSDRLFQVYTDSVGHCTFRLVQMSHITP